MPDKACDNCWKQFRSRQAGKGRYTRFCSKSCEIEYRSKQTLAKTETLKVHLHYLYWDLRMTYNEMAQELCCSISTVRRLLQRTGIYCKGQPIYSGRSMKGRPHTLEHNRKVWEAIKDKLGEGFLKSQGRFKKSIGTASEAAQISNAAKWSNPETKDSVLKNMMKAVGAKPNLTELRLQTLLDQYFPHEWKFVGNGEIIIGGKLPDFININGKKQIIELFGIFWHPLFDVAKRTDHFRQYGFKTLIIWEDELENEAKLVKKIKAFTRRKEYAQH